MRLNVTNAERDQITLALRSWSSDLREPLDNPRSALARRRRRMAADIGDLADRIDMADIIPMPEIDPNHRAEPEGIPSLCRICGKPTRQWPDGRFPIHASVQGAYEDHNP
jgi:hypothetical protein